MNAVQVFAGATPGPQRRERTTADRRRPPSASHGRAAMEAGEGMPWPARRKPKGPMGRNPVLLDPLEEGHREGRSGPRVEPSREGKQREQEKGEEEYRIPYGIQST
ncbi:hypothetical protein Dimus_028470 [Dionaea muscipula]